ATAGTDYTPVTSVTIPAFNSFVGVSIPFLRDVIIESTEYFNVKIAALSVPASVATFDPFNFVTGSILDVPVNPGNIRSLAVGNETVTEGPNANINFVVTASSAGSSTRNVTVRYETVQRSALSNIDYISSSGMLTFSPSETQKTIPVRIVDDTIVEVSEYFELRLFSASSNATIRQGTGIGTILDNDGPINLYIDHAPAIKEGLYNTFRVWRDNPTRAVTGLVRTTSGTATNNVDYFGGDYPFSIPIGSYETTVSVLTKFNNDPPELPQEYYTAKIISTTGNVTVAFSTGTGTITEAMPSLKVSPWGDTVIEGNREPNSFWVLFAVSQDHELPVSIPYYTQDRTAFAVSDYTHASGTVRFNKGVIDPETQTDYQKFVKVFTRPDLFQETPIWENLAFIVGEPTNAILTPDEKTHTLTIRDDDDFPPLSLSPDEPTAEEPNLIYCDVVDNRGSVKLDIPDGWPRGGSVTVNVSGTAIYPRDYSLKVEHNRGSTVPPINWSQNGMSLSITLPTDTSIKTIYIYVDAKSNFIEADPGRTVIFTLVQGAGGSGTVTINDVLERGQLTSSPSTTQEGSLDFGTFHISGSGGRSLCTSVY
ncbi:MAG: Calx-beta domain-containing protein, partial [Pirellula sp.]